MHKARLTLLLDILNVQLYEEGEKGACFLVSRAALLEQGFLSTVMGLRQRWWLVVQNTIPLIRTWQKKLCVRGKANLNFRCMAKLHSMHAQT